MTPNQLPVSPIEKALSKLRSAQICHPKAVQHLIEEAIEALAQQAQEPVAWMFTCRKRPDLKELSFEQRRSDLTVRGFKARPLVFGDTTPQPQPAQQVPEKCLTCSGHGMIGGHMPDGSGHGEPCPDCNAPPVPAPVDERAEFEASMRKKHGWEDRDFKSDSSGYFDGHTATAWLGWQAHAALQSPAPQATKGQP